MRLINPIVFKKFRNHFLKEVKKGLSIIIITASPYGVTKLELCYYTIITKKLSKC